MNLIKIWLATALQFILLKFACLMKYVDIPPGHDFYFDRIVSLELRYLKFRHTGYHYYYGYNKHYQYHRSEERIPITIGVMISPDLILTSYNPFRLILKDKDKAGYLVAYTLVARHLDYLGKQKYRWTNLIMANELDCGRQIQHLPDEEIEDDLWHGMGRRNCPLHDLLVFRIQDALPKNVKIAKTRDYMGKYVKAAWDRGNTYDKDIYYQKREYYIDGEHWRNRQHYSLLLTDLAKPGDIMGNVFKYCESSKSRLLRVIQFNAEDNALEDCGRWLPREWGHFICILNNKNSHNTMLSGAMLISEGKLFGVGSFVLSRSENSILVFTDVRRYHDLILNTCTYSDSGEKKSGERDELFDFYQSYSRHFQY